MEEPGTAGALLRERLPKAIAGLLAPGEPELWDGTFVDDELRESRTDRLYRMELKEGGPAYVYCLVEHKSAPDPRIGLQLLRYLVRIWERLDREADGRGTLPPVIPLVVYHGAQEWRSAQRFSGMVSADETIRPHLLDFPFGVVDLGRVDDELLSRNIHLRIGLLVLKHAVVEVADEDRVEAVVKVLTELGRVSERFWEVAMRYIIGAYREMDRATLSNALKRVVPEKEQQMLSIAAQEWLAQGRAEGRAEGAVRGKADALVHVLQKRFGAVASDVREKISRADAVQIDEWLDRAIEAASLETVFMPRTH
jgi:predicted transposase/invertase (TIGR01784 family)